MSSRVHFRFRDRDCWLTLGDRTIECTPDRVAQLLSEMEKNDVYYEIVPVAPAAPRDPTVYFMGPV